MVRCNLCFTVSFPSSVFIASLRTELEKVLTVMTIYMWVDIQIFVFLLQAMEDKEAPFHLEIFLATNVSSLLLMDMREAGNKMCRFWTYVNHSGMFTLKRAKLMTSSLFWTWLPRLLKKFLRPTWTMSILQVGRDETISQLLLVWIRKVRSVLKFAHSEDFKTVLTFDI